MSKAISRHSLLVVVALLISITSTASAQTTEFTYQGRLVDGSMPANASYDFEFKLFEDETGGTEIGTQTRLGVLVANGIFTVRLDFGAAAFKSSPRFLEIFVKPAGGPTFTALTPRQPVTSAPHAIKSLSADTAQSATEATNSAQLGGVAASQYVITTDSRMTDARNPLPNSDKYVQNTTTPQATSNFNISGDGTAGGTLSANTVNAATQYNIGANRVLSVTGIANTFGGIGAGTSSTGSSNSFFGRSAGGGLTNSGSNNSFFGERAGASNTTGFAKSFFGSAVGLSNTSGGTNSFFGTNAGFSNTTGGNNSFYGVQAGFSTTTGFHNSFFGRGAGLANTTGNSNSFFGFEAGTSDTAGGGGSYFGSGAGRSNTDGLFNSFFGYHAGFSNIDSPSNSFFGYSAGVANTTGDRNSFFGASTGVSNTTGGSNSFFGQNAGEDNTTGGGNTFVGRWSGKSNVTGGGNTFVGVISGLNIHSGTDNVFIGYSAGGGAAAGSNLTMIGSNTDVSSGTSLVYATAIGAEAEVSTSNTVPLGRANGFDTVRVSGLLVVNGLGPAGSTDVCRNASNQLSTCSSSLRYKTSVQPFLGGLDVVRRLRPITFSWKDGGMHDVGFGAEEVEKIEPLLTTRNSSGEIEGVKYGQLTTVLVNAVQQQQAQIAEQQRNVAQQRQRLKQQESQIKQQRYLIEGLKRLVCLSHPRAAVCKNEN